MPERKKINKGMVLASPAYKHEGWLRCVIAGAERPRSIDGMLLLYVFGPIISNLKEQTEFSKLAPEEAIDVLITGTVRVHEGKWPILGEVPSFGEQLWRVPPFGRVDSLNPKKGYLVYYTNDTLSKPRSVEEVTGQVAAKYPRDQVWGVDIATAQATQKLVNVN